MLNTAIAATLASAMAFAQAGPAGPERKTCKAADGVPIVYSAAGSGEPALVFIHGGFANRGFWDEQIKAFSPRTSSRRTRPARTRRFRNGTEEMGPSGVRGRRARRRRRRGSREADRLRQLARRAGRDRSGPAAARQGPGRRRCRYLPDPDFKMTVEYARQRAEAFRATSRERQGNGQVPLPPRCAPGPRGRRRAAHGTYLPAGRLSNPPVDGRTTIRRRRAGSPSHSTPSTATSSRPTSRASAT